MRYRIAVEPVNPAQRRSIFDAFQAASQKAFPNAGIEFQEAGRELLISCPDRTVRAQVREFIRGRSDVREPVIPPPTTL